MRPIIPALPLGLPNLQTNPFPQPIITIHHRLLLKLNPPAPAFPQLPAPHRLLLPKIPKNKKTPIFRHPTSRDEAGHLDRLLDQPVSHDDVL
jgi:hypothetical protein